MKLRLSLFCMLAVFLVGCASSKAVVVPGANQTATPVERIAVLSDSVLADSVSINLSALGFFVAPAIPGTDAMTPSNPSQRDALMQAGFDGLLVVKSSNDGEGRPQTANALVYSMETGQLITGVSWQNGHGFGIRGSVTNQAMKVNQHEAAVQIARELAKALPR